MVIKNLQGTANRISNYTEPQKEMHFDILHEVYVGENPVELREFYLCSQGSGYWNSYSHRTDKSIEFGCTPSQYRKNAQGTKKKLQKHSRALDTLFKAEMPSFPGYMLAFAPRTSAKEWPIKARCALMWWKRPVMGSTSK